jgi:hypothetical protein
MEFPDSIGTKTAKIYLPSKKGWPFNINGRGEE